NVASGGMSYFDMSPTVASHDRLPTRTGTRGQRHGQRRHGGRAWLPILVGSLLALACAAHPAHPSQLIDRNATGVQLVVDAKGEAMLNYTAGGKLKHVLAWGAVNAIPPNRTHEQTAFSLDYSGGW